MRGLSKLYLGAYNCLQTLGWSYILIQSVRFVLKNGTAVGLWSNYGSCVLVFQSLAGLEVLHCLVGLVDASALMTSIQLLSRLYYVWGILHCVKEVQDLPFVAIIMIAWGIAEVARYAFYFTNIYGKSPYFLTWCRYSFFILLYPLGVFGEVGGSLLALNHISHRKVYSIDLPNAANFSFSYYYFCILIILVYIPGLPFLYSHMLYRRRKVLENIKVLDSSSSGKKMS